jgi:hypothetical protein
MISTSATYTPYADVRHCGISVSFELIDVDAANKATATTNSPGKLSQIKQTHDRNENMSAKYALLEKDYWALDGTFDLLPRDISTLQTGWWSSVISNTDGAFTTNPALAFSWPDNQSSVGYTICFDEATGDYASKFIVRVRDAAGKLINERTIENNSPRCVVDMPTEGYRSVSFVFLSTSKPRRRVRVAEVLFGIVQHFTEANTESATLENSFSPDSSSLPSSELTLVIDNADAAWNMANPKGIYAYLQQSQPLDIHFTINGEAVYMGRYYFTSASAEDESMTAKITAHDKLYWLDGAKYHGGSSGAWTLGDAIADVLAASGVDIPIKMPETLAARQVGRSLPKDCSCRDAIRLLAQAACSACRMDRTGTLIFFDPLEESTISDTLDYNNMAAMPQIAVAEKVNKLELLARNDYDPDSADLTYIVSAVASGESPRAAFCENAVTVDGKAVALWLLTLRQRRLTYRVQERGNPARDIADTVRVSDAYGGVRPAVVLRQSFAFDGGLSCETELGG